MNLTPEQLAALTAARDAARIDTSKGDGYRDSAGNAYVPLWEWSNGGGEGDTPVARQIGWGGGTPREPNAQYSIYDTDGTDTGRTGNWNDPSDSDALFYTMLAIMGGGIAGGLAGLGGAAGAGGGAAGAAGGGGALVGSSAGMVAPAGLGAATSGTGLWGAGAAGLGGAAGAAGGGGALMGSSGSMVAPAGLGAAGSGTGIYGAGAASGTGGLLGQALGAGTSLLGAVAGAQGQKTSETTTKDIPEWLKPYITGEGGLLSQTQQQLSASRSPERMAQWDQMRNIGMGLLSKPQVGNPTANWQFNR